MNRNIGERDQIIRLTLGIAITVVGASFKSWFGAIGIIPILTAAIGRCPIYLPFGISTSKK